MKREKKKSIEIYRFEDDRQKIKALIAGNLILAMIFLIVDWSNLFRDSRTQICLISGITFLVLYIYYDWQSPKMNILLMVIYLIIFMIEFFFLGIPESPIEFHPNSLSKGAMFEMFIGFLPYLYIGIRIAIISPLIQVILSSKNLKEGY